MTMNYPALILLVLLLVQPAAALYRFDFPGKAVGKTYLAETRLKKDGSLFGRSAVKAEKAAYGGKEYLVLTGESSGTVQGKAFTSKVVRYFLLEDGKISSSSIKGETLDGGRPWTDYAINFDWPNLSAAVEYHDREKKKEISKVVRLEPNMVAIQDLDLYLSSLPARKVRAEKIPLLFPDGQTINIIVKLADQPETITVQGGPLLCRKVELKPDLGLISNFIPNVYYWLRAEPPYEAVRYSGAISGPGSPDVIQEIKLAD